MKEQPHTVPDLPALRAAFSRAEEMDRTEDFFREIFTAEELRDLSLRWTLMRLLREGWTQREIAARLGVSLCKVTRGSRILKLPRSVSRRILEESREGD